MDHKDFPDYTPEELEKLLEDDGYVGRYQPHPEDAPIPAAEAVCPEETAGDAVQPEPSVQTLPPEAPLAGEEAQEPQAPDFPAEEASQDAPIPEEVPSEEPVLFPEEAAPLFAEGDAPLFTDGDAPLFTEEAPLFPEEEASLPSETDGAPEEAPVLFPTEEPLAQQIPDLPQDDLIQDFSADSMPPDAQPEDPAAPEEPASELPPEPEDPVEVEFRNAADGEEFDEMFNAAPQAPKAPVHKRPARKGRPKRKKGEGFFGIPNILATVVWLAITVLIGVTLGRMIWICAADVLAFGREDKPVTITIYETDTIDDITRKLHEGQLIRYPGLFKFYASLAVDEGEIHPGIWDLNTRYDYHALVNMMSPSSSRDVIKVMIPEGYTSRQIFSLLEKEKICTAQDLGAYAANGELEDFWFLEGLERGEPNCLDGFLFPDTYQFYKNDSPENVLNKLLGNFNNRFDEEMRSQLDSLNAHLTDLMHRGGKSDEFIAQNQFTIHDLVIVASMIEKETSSAEEGYTIASVIYNRLFNWGSNPAYLNIDASIVYALDGKTDLTTEDLKIDSPYNTYTNTGLTPGAISNPGLASLKAALAPQDTDYYYYVLDPATGAHRFTTTYDEHQAAIASIGGNE